MRMWSIIDYRKVKEVMSIRALSSKSLEEYDCVSQEERTLSLTFFSGNISDGNALYTDSDAQKWTPISPGSLNESLWKAACGKKY